MGFRVIYRPGTVYIYLLSDKNGNHLIFHTTKLKKRHIIESAERRYKNTLPNHLENFFIFTNHYNFELIKEIPNNNDKYSMLSTHLDLIKHYKALYGDKLLNPYDEINFLEKIKMGISPKK